MFSSNPMEPAKLSHGFTIRKDVLANLGFSLIIPFCSLITHTVLPIPPTLILFIFGSVILLPLAYDKTYNATKIVLPLVLIAYIVVSQTVMLSPVKHFLGVVFAISYYIITVSFGPYLSGQKQNQLIEKFITYSIIILIIECIWRYTHPDLKYAQYENTGSVLWIYQYKMEGIMYIDSNATAIHIVVLFFFLLYRESEALGNYRLYKLILLSLLILTISRGAWAGALLGLIYFYFIRGKSPKFYILSILTLSIILFLTYFFYIRLILKNDMSYNSKFDIVSKVINYAITAPIDDKLFGVGFSHSLEVLGIYAHNFIFVVFVESGLIGLMLMLFLFTHFIINSRQKALIIIIPFIITTLSASITFTPYLYMIMALIYLDQKRKAFST